MICTPKLVRVMSLFLQQVVLQEMIERHAHWNEDIGEWQLKCVAYTGNNMRKTQCPLSPGPKKEVSTSLNESSITVILRFTFNNGIALQGASTFFFF